MQRDSRARLAAVLVAVIALALMATAAWPQSSRTIKIILPFAPGGPAYNAIRILGQQISATTKDWVETYQPNQVGANYTAHLTVGLATVEDLKAMQAEPFDAFDVHPAGLAVYQLGNNGTARTRLKEWPLNA